MIVWAFIALAHPIALSEPLEVSAAAAAANSTSRSIVGRPSIFCCAICVFVCVCVLGF
jgi:hypothetical protein